MNIKYLKSLEYDKIVEKLSTYCKTYIGKQKVSALLPLFNNTDVVNQLAFTNEAVSLIYRKGSVPISDIPDITLSIKNLESDGVLSTISLLNIIPDNVTILPIINVKIIAVLNIFLAFFYLTKREKIAIIKAVLRNDVMNVLKEGDRFGKTD